MSRILRHFGALAAILVCFLSGDVQAGPILSIELTESNKPIGPAPAGGFGTVTVEAVAVGEVLFTVELAGFLLANYNADGRLGWANFAFNFDELATGGITFGTLPSGWEILGDDEPSPNKGGFGTFLRFLDDGGSHNNVELLIFSVMTTDPALSGMALLNAFMQPNDAGYFYKAMMNGLEPDYNNENSFYAAAPVSVPEPGTLGLLGAGLLLLAFSRRRKFVTTSPHER